MEQVTDRVWVARHEHLDVNAGVIVGDRGIVVVDSLWSAAAARDLVTQIRAAGLDGPILGVVNTHDHDDHVLGNVELAAPSYAHEAAAVAMARLDPPVIADHTFSSVAVIDLGDLLVEVIHPGRGHTAGDAVVRLALPDGATVLFAGDLVEQGAPPSYGEDSYPLDWPLTLDFLENLISPSTLIVPGHGAVVDKEYVADQRAVIGGVAETIRELAGRGIPVDQALSATAWPLPTDHLEHAVRRGYEHLPRAARSLPLA